MANRTSTAHAIIGMGAAGVAASLEIRRKDPSCSISIITSDPYFYYSRPGLAYLLAGEIPDKQLFQFPDRFFRDRRIDVLQGEVESIDVDHCSLTLEGQRRIYYGRLLIATGAQALIPDVPGISLDGVVKLDNFADAANILKASRRAKTAVVVGGGITALEIVEGLLAQGIETHYFLRSDRYWGSVLDEIESRIVEHRLMDEGVLIHYFTDLTEVVGKNGKVIGVRAMVNGESLQLPCQIVAVAIGIKPRVQLAVKSGIKTQRGILTDSHLRTSAPFVFAAGDVAQVFDRMKGEYLLDSLWNPAIEMGQVAGANMAGGDLTYEKKFPFNVTRLAGLVTTIIGRVGKSEKRDGVSPKGDADVIGIMRGDSEVWRLQPDALVTQTYGGDNRLRLYINEQAIIGAVIMGDQTLSHPIQLMIQNEVDIRPIRDQLLQRNADLPSILSIFWERYSYAAKIA